MKIFKIELLTILVFLIHTPLFAQRERFEMPESIEKQTVTYAIPEGDSLQMDIYRLKEKGNETQPVMLFQFGGSFKTGWRDRLFYGNYLQAVTEMGFTVVSIDYRLGMEGKKYNLKTLTAKSEGLADAVQLAVEDLFTATAYLTDHAQQLHIHPDSILASGSSAGAISVLQADWVIKNRKKGTEILPEGFAYTGIVAFAGGIYSRSGRPKYKHGDPAPTLMFHGSKDRMVPYHTIRLFNIGMFPSKNLHRRMKKAGNDYVFVDMKGKDHYYGAETAMTEGLFITEWFLEEFIRQGNGKQTRIKIDKGF